ncbi:hypothetical protein KCP76_15500 [Salmonella enterica subsp. enterica serovar Weltevreden]|nr:hypothetical protein KCP76_15500 [Salmonella enterica subsp. enterica serovar Weltevreden]
MWPDVGHFQAGYPAAIRLGYFYWPLLVCGRLARHVPDWRPACCLAAISGLRRNPPSGWRQEARKEYRAAVLRKQWKLCRNIWCWSWRSLAFQSAQDLYPQLHNCGMV